jgi:hypothetical protein
MKCMTALLLTLLFATAGWAQVNGNKEITTKTIAVEGIIAIDIDLYATVVIDCEGPEQLTITVDKNLLGSINTEVENGLLVLKQKEWIQPSAQIKITIGAPNLERVQQSTHETTRLRNINRNAFQATALVGKLILEGTAQTLSAAAKIGTVDARSLRTENVNVNIWGRGNVLLDAPQKISGEVNDNGQVVYNKEPASTTVKTQNGGKLISTAEKAAQVLPEARFIKFKVKNNSTNRINCYVVGPKPDGSQFSYGFPLMPGQSRSKDWSIGSKVYRVTGLGTRILLREITAADEGQVVKLYQKKGKQ